MNQIHASAVIGPDVILGNNNVIGPNAVLLGPLWLGDFNWVGPSVVIGSPPQSKGWEHTIPWNESQKGQGISIGSRNIFREFVTIQSPTTGATSIGDDCFLMTQVHIPHDCKVGNSVTIANSTQIAGHCVIQDFVNIGLSVNIHQFSVIGQGAMVGMGSVVKRNIPPLSIAFGNPARVHGANKVGMQRLGYTSQEIERVDQIIRSGLEDLNLEGDVEFFQKLLTKWYQVASQLKHN